MMYECLGVLTLALALVACADRLLPDRLRSLRWFGSGLKEPRCRARRSRRTATRRTDVAMSRRDNIRRSQACPRKAVDRTTLLPSAPKPWYNSTCTERPCIRVSGHPPKAVGSATRQQPLPRRGPGEE